MLAVVIKLHLRSDGQDALEVVLALDGNSLVLLAVEVEFHKGLVLLSLEGDHKVQLFAVLADLDALRIHIPSAFASIPIDRSGRGDVLSRQRIAASPRPLALAVHQRHDTLGLGLAIYRTVDGGKHHRHLILVGDAVRFVGIFRIGADLVVRPLRHQCDAAGDLSVEVVGRSVQRPAFKHRLVLGRISGLGGLLTVLHGLIGDRLLAAVHVELHRVRRVLGGPHAVEGGVLLDGKRFVGLHVVGRFLGGDRGIDSPAQEIQCGVLSVLCHTDALAHFDRLFLVHRAVNRDCGALGIRLAAGGFKTVKVVDIALQVQLIGQLDIILRDDDAVDVPAVLLELGHIRVGCVAVLVAGGEGDPVRGGYVALPGDSRTNLIPVNADQVLFRRAANPLRAAVNGEIGVAENLFADIGGCIVGEYLIRISHRITAGHPGIGIGPIL